MTMKTSLQAGSFFQYKKHTEELVQGIQSDPLRIANTLNHKNKKAQKYVNIVNLTKKEH